MDKGISEPQRERGGILRFHEGLNGLGFLCWLNTLGWDKLE